MLSLPKTLYSARLHVGILVLPQQLAMVNDSGPKRVRFPWDIRLGDGWVRALAIAHLVLSWMTALSIQALGKAR